MASRQLIDYVREQVANGMGMDQLRTLLSQEGWATQDIEDAIAHCQSRSHSHNVKKHHTNFLAVAILGIVVLILAGGLFFLVFNQPDPGPRPNPNPYIPNQNNQLTGWAVCADMENSIEKDVCYQDINEEDNLFDCDTIGDATERAFCYRAKEAVVLASY